MLVGGVALDNGGFDATSWGWTTLLPLVIVGVALVLGRARRPNGLALAFLGLFAALTAWTWLSVAWSNDVSASVLDAERLLVYLSAAAAFLLLEQGQVKRFLVGLIAAISLVGVWALYLRAFGGPGSYDVASVSADATRRLAAPLGYSNALGVLSAIGIVLALGLATRVRRPLAAVPVLVLLPTLYFTYSRGAWLALGAGGAAALALAMPRLPRRLMVAVAIAVLCVGALALVRVGGPSGAIREFSHAGPSVKADRSRRLFSLSGSSRAQYWHVAWRDYRQHPWLGSGAGSFQRYWLQSRPAALPVLDAHSLYLETLAELGPVGLGLLAALLALPVAAAAIARRNLLVAPAFGGYVAYLVHAAQDWDWELPAVTLAALGCAAALLILAGREPRSPFGRQTQAAALVTTVLLALIALGALAGNETLAAANASLDADNPARAARDARWAKQLAPWSPDPWRLHGEALLSQGNLNGAKRDFLTALRKDPSDWDTWVDLTLVTQGAEQKRAVEHAQRLNPLEQILPGGG
ncbi:MAG: O-antigen ligase family protein [Actinomycetota bacterium]|nr:O-antigen ligase family protein [Actinomycetota bacterium]